MRLVTLLTMLLVSSALRALPAPAPALSVTIPVGIISSPSGDQVITQPGSTFLIVNRLEVTDLLSYAGVLSGSVSGNAATATALAIAPSQCPGGFFAIGVQANGDANCSNTFPTGGVSFSTLYISGAARSYATQGMYLNWNISGGQGESSFVNNRGLGVGGFSWYNATPSGTLGPAIMTLDGNGVLTPLNGLNGNATSATRLAGTPTQCASGQVAVGIAPNGNAQCITTGASVQWASTSSVCTTGSSSYATCSSSVVWPTAFASTGYTAACMGITPSNGRALIQGITSQTTTGVSFNVVTEGSVAVTFAKVSCVGVL